MRKILSLLTFLLFISNAQAATLMGGNSGSGGGGTPSGPAGGDLGGTFPNPNVKGISAGTQPINSGGAGTFSAAGAASTPGLQVTGAPYNAGTGTTDFPQLFVQPTGSTAVTGWSTGGTLFGINASSGFAGNLIDLYVNGGMHAFQVNQYGDVLTNSQFRFFNGGTRINSSTNGQLELLNSAQAGFTILQFGGSTSSYPAIAVNGTGLTASLADSSALTSFSAASITSTTPIAPASGGTGEASLTGIRYANGTSADTAATSTNLQSAIGNGVYVPVGNYYGGTSTGAVNVLAITLPSGLGTPTLAQLTGIPITFLPNLANTTTTPTLTVNSLAATTIVKGSSTALAAGDIALSSPATVIYNGTNFVLQNPQSVITQVQSVGTFTAPSLQTTGSGTFQSSSSNNTTTLRGGQNANSSGALGGVVVQGAVNTGSGTGGSAIFEPGSSVYTSAQPTGTAFQSFYTASALSQTFEVVSGTTTQYQVAATPLGGLNPIGIAQTVGGTNTVLYVATEGESTVRFDGTPVVNDFVCGPLLGTGTVGLAHDNGTNPCPSAQALGIVIGAVSGTGSGATATVLLGTEGVMQSVTTITSSATPAIVSGNGLQTITLSANAAPTISGIAAGQRVTFQICQPAGTSYSWAWPASVHGGMTIGTALNACSIQSFNSFNGTTLVAETVGVQNVAP